MPRAPSSGIPPGSLMLEPPLLGEEGRRELYPGICLGETGHRERDGLSHPSAHTLARGPIPSPPRGPSRWSRCPRQSQGQPRPGPALGSPQPRSPSQPPGLYLQGRPPGAAPCPRGPPGRAGSWQGVSSRSAPAGLRVALPAAPRGCRSGRAARGGGGWGGGRGAAGRGLHPPLSTATAKARAPPGRARAQPGPRRAPPRPRPGLPASQAESPHTRASPFIFAHPVSGSGPSAQEGYRLGGHKPATEKKGRGWPVRGWGSTGVVAHKRAVHKGFLQMVT